jgi:hypothetical protein
MNKQLDDYLCQKYPKIFRDRNGDMKKTCMVWGFPGNGWFFLLDSLCGSIQWHIDNPPSQPKNRFFDILGWWYNKCIWNTIFFKIARKFSQPIYLKLESLLQYHHKWVRKEVPQVVASTVKEKFGGLSFYYNGGDDVIRGMVTLAESLSYHICENCGTMNELVARNSTGWRKTTCACCCDLTKKQEHIANRNTKLVKMFAEVRSDKNE